MIFQCSHRLRMFCFLTLMAVAAALVTPDRLVAQTVSDSDGSTVTGQQNGEGASGGDVAEQTNTENWRRTLDSIGQALTREGVTNQDLDRAFPETERIETAADELRQELQPRLDQLLQQREEIGDPPKDGEPPEAQEITDRRAAIDDEISKLDARLKEAQLASVRARQIRKSIVEKRRADFVRQITRRSEGVATVTFWQRFASGFSGYASSLGLLIRDSMNVLAARLIESPWKLLILPFGLFAIGTGYWYIRNLLLQLRNGLEFEDETTMRARSVRALYRVLRQGVLTALVPTAIYQLLAQLDLLTARFDLFLAQFALVAGFVLMARSLLMSYFSPAETQLRILRITDAAARRVYSISWGLVLVTALLTIIQFTAVLLVSPFEVSLGLSVLLSLVYAVCGVSILTILYRDKNHFTPLPPGERVRWPALVRHVSALLIAAVVAATLGGYIALAEFLAIQLLFGLVVLGTLYLILEKLEYLFQLSQKRAIEAAELTATGSEPVATSQAGVIGFGIAKLSAIVFASILLMLPWGYRTSDIYDLINRAFFGFSIGGLDVSPSTILLALALFGVGYFVTVAIRNWLNNRLFPTTSLDDGVSNSISTIFGYVGIVFASLLAISAAGFDLSNLAIVAGALSVGVGFGLQSIVNNFVSGLILLTERPIKAGDWVVTSGGEGTVKKISVRSTEIETFNRSTIIVPNSNLITETVTNWTYADKLGRVIIPIGVGYDSDPRKVEKILLDCANAHKLVLGKPEPYVNFANFGSSSLDFELRCFMSDINNSLTVQSDLRFAILDALRKAKIEIPYPQHDIHLKSDHTRRK